MYSRPVGRLLIGTFARRSFTSQARNHGRQQYQWSRTKWNYGSATSTGVAAVALSGGIAFVLHASTKPSDNKLATPSKVDYNEVRKSIAALLDDNDFDDGSYGPLFVRLGWHASGTYSKLDSSGGSNGGCMRFEPESSWGANKG
jgi:cytochrome c peroxidase